MSRSKLVLGSALRRFAGLVSLSLLLAVGSCSDSPPEKEHEPTLKHPLFTIQGNPGSVTCVAYSPDGNRIASCHCEPPGHADSQDPQVKPKGPSERVEDRVLREVKIWDAHTGKEQVSINQGIRTSSVIFYPDGQHLAGAVANVVVVWDSTTAKETLVLKGHTDIVSDLDVSRDGKRLVTASYDGTVKVWDAVRGTCLHTLKGHPHQVYSVSFSPDARRVASKGREEDFKGVIRIWDVATEEQILTLTHDTLIGSAVISPDGQRIASFSNERGKDTRPGLIEVWNAFSGKLLLTRKAHSAPATCIAYSPDGRYLATGSEDGTVIVRDARSGDDVVRLGQPGRGRFFTHITSIAFGPDGGQLVASSWGGTINMWDLKEFNGNQDRR